MKRRETGTGRPERDPDLCWARTLNRLGEEMDAAVDGVHPSAWEELVGDKRKRWLALARSGPRTPVITKRRRPETKPASPEEKDRGREHERATRT